MQDGFIKVAAGTPEIRVADCDFNKNCILKLAQEAGGLGVKLLALPELCVTGYTCADLFFQQALLDKAEKTLLEIIAETSRLDMVIVLGCPIRGENRLYNCAAVINKGKCLALVPKSHMPNYNEFYEKRHFSDFYHDMDTKLGKITKNVIFCADEMRDFSFGVEICEDLWTVCPPSGSLALGGANIIVNISASNEIIGKDSYRRELVKGQSARLMAGYVYANAGEGESTQDLVFSGHSLIAENGTVLTESRHFTTGLAVSEIDVKRLSAERMKNTEFNSNCEVSAVSFSVSVSDTEITRKFYKFPFVPADSGEKSSRCEQILSMQANALKKRLVHTGAKSLVIGISGGLDSTLALIAAVRSMKLLNRPASDIITVSMPCFGTTKRTRSNAEKLCSEFGTTFREIDISNAVTVHLADIKHDINVHDTTFENAQARERTQVLMDIANQSGGMVLGTGDLSELALGWATYNGDHMSMYGINASVPKTLVRHIVRYFAESCDNKSLSDVLFDVLDTPVSPELLPADNEGKIAQKTEDIVGPYELHDFFLYYGIRWSFSPKKVFRIAKLAFDGEYSDEIILKWLKIFYRRFFAQQFKRSCIPDGVKIGSVSLSPRGDWRMPSDAVSKIWLDELEDIV